MSTPTKTALIVDDSLTIRRLVASLLKSQGYTVIESANGRAALDVAPAEGVSLVVTDLNMPEMDGLDFVRELRTRAAYQFTPMVVLTTEWGGATQQQARAAGASAWLSKPFDAAKLTKVVNHLVT
jgi:two-component system chemotaxis response regulator CheY